MSSELGEFLTRWSVRAALACYVVRVARDSSVARSAHPAATTRWIWTAGLLCYWLHVVCAFQFYHDWSHSAAYAFTAQTTAEVIGLEWGGGLYLNYLFTAWWTMDVAAWWRPAACALCASARYRRARECVFAFMFLNATVVFGPPFWKWLALPAAAALAMAWYRRRLRRPVNTRK